MFKEGDWYITKIRDSTDKHFVTDTVEQDLKNLPEALYYGYFMSHVTGRVLYMDYYPS